MALELFVIPPLVKAAVSTVIGAKIVGFALNIVAAPTSFSTRESILEHVQHVVDGLDSAGIVIEPHDRTSLQEDCAILRYGAKQGWHEDYETAALGRVIVFLSWAHAKSTGSGVGSLVSAHVRSAQEKISVSARSILDSLIQK
jgi:hypothetical protein